MIIGTALGGLLATQNGACGNSANNGLFGGLLGGRNACATEGMPIPVPVPMPVTEHQYYEDSIRDMRWYHDDTVCAQRKYYEDSLCNQKGFFHYAEGVGQRICDLEQRVAVDETSIAKNFEFMASQNEWQNKFFDEKMRYADLLEQCRIQNATCKCIKGEVYASPSDLADPYTGRRQVLGSFVEPFCNTGWNNGCGGGWNNGGCGTGWNNGCGC